jgi:hypothetical protein
MHVERRTTNRTQNREPERAGGSFPIRSRTRGELLYSMLNQRLMVAPCRVKGASFRSESPRPWADARFILRRPVMNRSFDLHPNGKRVALALNSDLGASSQQQLVLVFNFLMSCGGWYPIAPQRQAGWAHRPEVHD